MSKIYNSKETLISYLNSHIGQNLSRSAIITDTGISKARLSELIKELKSEGYVIDTPPRSGLVRLEQGEITQNITAADVRLWLILYVLSQKVCTYVELIKGLLVLHDLAYESQSLIPQGVYTDSQIQKLLIKRDADEEELCTISETLSLYTLRKDLQQLTDLKYVESGKIRDVDGIHDKYWLSETAPVILFENDDKVADFLTFDSELEETAAQPLVSVIDKLKNIYDWNTEEKTTAFLGRSKNIAKEEMEGLNRFLRFPYKDSQLEITYAPNEKESYSKIMVGRIFFSTEAGCFYALCKEETKKGRQKLAIKKIIGIKEAKPLGVNTFWKSQDADIFYKEMFTGSEDTPEKVVILFKEADNTIEQIQELQGLRHLSSLKKLSEPIEGYDYVYQDTIRGTTNMANYLRGFGDKALAIAPKGLRTTMRHTYDKIIEAYENSED